MVDPNKHWWAQAEAVVGFYNAWQVSGQEQFRAAAWRAWEYIEEKVVDRVHGEWHAKLKPDGTPWKAEEDRGRVPGGRLEMPVSQQPGLPRDDGQASGAAGEAAAGRGPAHKLICNTDTLTTRTGSM